MLTADHTSLMKRKYEKLLNQLEEIEQSCIESKVRIVERTVPEEVEKIKLDYEQTIKQLKEGS